MTKFLKMHGLGNDFVVFDARKHSIEMSGSIARTVADRRFGIGCDQVIIMEPARADGDAAMRIYNADGSEVESCGNAARCVAQLLMEQSGMPGIRLETKGGPLVCTHAAKNLVTVDMGAPRFDWREIPLAHEVDTASFTLAVPGFTLASLQRAAAVSVGNPHCVLFVDDAEAAPVESLGPALERHPLFPMRTNVEFVSIIGKERLRMRVWERGAGVTMACGTGACAAAVCAMRRGLCGSRVEIVLDGGPLVVAWQGDTAPILMTGPASLSFEGDVDLSKWNRA